MKSRAKFIFVQPTQERDFLQIVDVEGTVSVTNDMEQVLKDIEEETGIDTKNVKIIYRDSHWSWDGVYFSEGKIRFLLIQLPTVEDAMQNFNLRMQNVNGNWIPKPE